jgi:hypothetical protein
VLAVSLVLISNIDGSNSYQVENFSSSYDTSDNDSSKIKFKGQLLDRKVSASDPAKIKLKLRFVSNQNVSVNGGPVYPFGVINANSGEERIVLWSDRYRESKAISVVDGEVSTMGAVGVIRTHSPNESISSIYHIRSQDVQSSGRYVLRKNLEYKTRSGWENLSYSINFDLEKE